MVWNKTKDKVEATAEEVKDKAIEVKEEVTSTADKALKELEITFKEKKEDEQTIKDKAELRQIKSRILQQYVSPTTGYKGQTATPEERREVEDRARMILRQKKKAAEPKSG